MFSNTGTIAGSFDPGRLGKPAQEVEKDMMGSYMNDIMQAAGAGREYSWSNYIEAIRTQLHLLIVPVHVASSTTS